MVPPLRLGLRPRRLRRRSVGGFFIRSAGQFGQLPLPATPAEASCLPWNRRFRADSLKPVLLESPQRFLIQVRGILTPERTGYNALRALERRCVGTNGLRTALIGDVYCPEWVN